MEQQLKQFNDKKPRSINPQTLEFLIARKNGDFGARQKLIKINIRAAVYVAKRLCYATLLPLEDVVSIGVIGLIKAVDNYVMELGNFESFMFHCIENEIKKYIAYINTKKNKPTGKVISLQDYFITGEEATYEDIAYDQEVDTEAEALGELTKEELQTLMSERLSEKEIQVLFLRFGFLNNDCFSLPEIGKILGTSRQRVYQIEQEALQKLKKHIKLKQLVGGFKD